ncbi:hypothetical protein [Arthrobacter sp. Soil782]|uniref:hypothetical protein n=1 Tax=Arthrobacter sp. Soil782 TaxID=1736410 RepID=UPI0012F8FEB8|nr:hypothetical protein [Arthrobacter sp. Soil782]
MKIDHVGDIGATHRAILAPYVQVIEDSQAFRFGKGFKEISGMHLRFAVSVVSAHVTTV